MHEDFADRIRVKINAPELLEKYLKKKGFSPFHRKEEYKIFDFFPSLKEAAQLAVEASKEGVNR